MFKKICLLLLLLFIKGEGGELILFLACDTDAKNIELSVHNDLYNIRNEALRVSYHTGLPLKEFSFVGSELQPKSVLHTLQSLEIEDDDLVFFYFSGHGFRTPEKAEDPWPNLFFTQSCYGLDFGKVISILSKKHPRLLIAVADCCNNIMAEEVAPPVYRQGSAKTRKEKIANFYKKLFLETEGKILVASSEIGEFSWGIPKGALFTLALLESLKVESEKGSADWKKILERSSWKVMKYQHPYYEMEIR